MLDEDIIKKFEELEIEIITYSDIVNISESRGMFMSLYYLLEYGAQYVLKKVKIRCIMSGEILGGKKQ